MACPTRRTFVTLWVGAALVAGCGSSDGGSGADGTNPPVSVVGGSTDSPSYDDYVTAADETVDCLEDRGVNASYAEQNDGTLALNIAAGSVSETQMDEFYEECVSEHLRDVQDAYVASITPPDDEIDASMSACLSDLGVISGDDLTRDAMMAEAYALDEADPAFKEKALNCIDQAFVLDG